MRFTSMLLVVASCAPIQAEIRMPNPARTTDHVAARQAYEIGPFKDDHRYELTLEKWTPAELDFAIHLVNVGNCGKGDSYQFTLVDDRGHEYPMRELAPPVEKARSGHAGANLRETSWQVAFAAPVGPSTRSVIVRIRPREDFTCSALDFRWDFE